MCRIQPIQGWEYPDANQTQLKGFDSSNGWTMSSFSISQVNTSGHLKCLYARRYPCLYIERVGMFMFTKCLSNSLQKMEFLTEGSKILNWFVWIFLIEFCKELKRKFVNQFNVLLYHQDWKSLKVANMVTTFVIPINNIIFIKSNRYVQLYERLVPLPIHV